MNRVRYKSRREVAPASRFFRTAFGLAIVGGFVALCVLILDGWVNF